MFADSFCSPSFLDRSRRGWFTLASFALQALGLSVLLALPIFYTEGLPPMRLRDLLLTPPPASAPAPRVLHTTSPPAPSNIADGKRLAPRIIPIHTVMIQDPAPAPAFPTDGSVLGVFQGPHAAELSRLTNSLSHVAPPAVPAPTPAPSRPLSRWMEGNLVRKVLPIYPPLARSTGVQGSVLLQAIIGRDGKIEHVQVVSGHPLLSKAAVDAVAQWLYRPYYLNDQPVEVETQVTVNFILGH
jgi:periplasmic protein TonB